MSAQVSWEEAALSEHTFPVAAPDLDRPTAGHGARELDQWVIASLFWAATKVDDAAMGTLST